MISRPGTYRLSLATSAKALRAFTLIELLVVVAIIGLLAGIGIPALNAFNRRQTLTQATKNLKTDLRAARSQAISGVDGKRWGVHLVLSSNNYELFSVTGSAPGGFAYDNASEKQQKALPSGVTISAILVGVASPSPANVIFDRLTGAVSVRANNGTLLGTDIRITLTLSGTNRYVRVDAGGKIYEQ